VILDDLPLLSLNSVRSSHTGQRRATGGLSALTLAPLEKVEGRSVVPFLICLFAIWAGALFTIYLIRHIIV
jgi:hypothetical protein